METFEIFFLSQKLQSLVFANRTYTHHTSLQISHTVTEAPSSASAQQFIWSNSCRTDWAYTENRSMDMSSFVALIYNFKSCDYLSTFSKQWWCVKVIKCSASSVLWKSPFSENFQVYFVCVLLLLILFFLINVWKKL